MMVVKVILALLLFTSVAHAGLNTSCLQWPGGTQPAPASAQGYNCLRFSDRFTQDTTDASDTGKVTFNWFTHNAWPLGNAGVHWSTIGSATATPSSDYTIGGGSLVISSASLYGLFPVSDYGVVESLNSCRNLGGGAYRGRVIGPAFYVEVNATYGAQPGGFSDIAQFWPIAWLVPTDALTTSSQTHFVEADIFEAPFGEAVHDWNSSSAGEDHFFGPGTVGTMPVGTRNIPASRNPNADGGLTGKFERFANGTVNAAATVIYGSGVAPTGGGSSLGFPTGAYSPLNSEQFCILLSGWGGSNSWPATFTSVDGWTP